MNYTKTACFSGYRPEKFPFPLESDCESYINLQADIAHAIGKSVNAGYTRFLSGMARGFDLICSGILLEMKSRSPVYADLELVAVLPFAGHGFKGKWGDVHDLVLEQVSEVVTLAGKYHRDAYLERNRYMVEQSGRLLCYFDGQSGGTAQTVRYALRRGLEICNLADYDPLTDCYSTFTKTTGGL